MGHSLFEQITWLKLHFKPASCRPFYNLYPKICFTRNNFINRLLLCSLFKTVKNLSQSSSTDHGTQFSPTLSIIIFFFSFSFLFFSRSYHNLLIQIMWHNLPFPTNVFNVDRAKTKTHSFTGES